VLFAHSNIGMHHETTPDYLLKDRSRHEADPRALKTAVLLAHGRPRWRRREPRDSRPQPARPPPARRTPRRAGGDAGGFNPIRTTRNFLPLPFRPACSLELEAAAVRKAEIRRFWWRIANFGHPMIDPKPIHSFAHPARGSLFEQDAAGLRAEAGGGRDR